MKLRLAVCCTAVCRSSARILVGWDSVPTRSGRSPNLPQTKWTKYYLHSGGKANSSAGDGTLSTTPPNNEPPDRYRYDPLHPTRSAFKGPHVDGAADTREFSTGQDLGDTTMATEARRLFLRVAVGFFAAASAVAAEKAGETPGDRRHAIRYTEGDETVEIVQVKDAEWAAKRRDGRTITYDELERTEDYVELRNRSSKLHIRLRSGRCYWRQENGVDWKGWVTGEWIDRPPLPASEPPKPPDYCVRLAYFVPQDRTPVRNYEQKITLVMTAVAELFRGDLSAKGYKTARLKFQETDGRPVIHLVRGGQAAAHYNNAPAYDANEQWKRLVPEIRTQVGDPKRHLIVAFAETYDDGPAEHHWPGVLAMGGYFSADGGLAIYSSFLLRDEFCALTIDDQRRLFFDRTPVPGRRAIGHGPNSPRCEFVEDGLGAVAHELGHALGLPHDQREDDRDIMGNGFRNLRWNFSPTGMRGRRVGFSDDNARLLASSRHIAPDADTADNEPPRADVAITWGRNRAPQVSVKASDNAALRAIVFFDENAGTVVGGRELKGAAQEFQVPLPATLFRSGAVKLKVIVIDKGGNQTRVVAP